MANIKFTIKDIKKDGEDAIEVQREVEDNDEGSLTMAKKISIAFSYCLDNPYMISNILQVASAERNSLKSVEVTGDTESEDE